MYLPAMIGFLTSSLTLMILILSGFLLGSDILYPSFIYRALFTSWFTGFAFYGWSGYLMKVYFSALHKRHVEEIGETVVESMEIPFAEIKRIAGSEQIRQMEDE